MWRWTLFYVKVDFKGKERDCASLALLCIREFSKEKRILCIDVYPLTYWGSLTWERCSGVSIIIWLNIHFSSGWLCLLLYSSLLTKPPACWLLRFDVIHAQMCCTVHENWNVFMMYLNCHLGFCVEQPGLQMNWSVPFGQNELWTGQAVNRWTGLLWAFWTKWIVNRWTGLSLLNKMKCEQVRLWTDELVSSLLD